MQYLVGGNGNNGASGPASAALQTPQSVLQLDSDMPLHSAGIDAISGPAGAQPISFGSTQASGSIDSGTILSATPPGTMFIRRRSSPLAQTHYITPGSAQHSNTGPGSGSLGPSASIVPHTLFPHLDSQVYTQNLMLPQDQLPQTPIDKFRSQSQDQQQQQQQQQHQQQQQQPLSSSITASTPLSFVSFGQNQFSFSNQQSAATSISRPMSQPPAMTQSISAQPQSFGTFDAPQHQRSISAAAIKTEPSNMGLDLGLGVGLCAPGNSTVAATGASASVMKTSDIPSAKVSENGLPSWLVYDSLAPLSFPDMSVPTGFPPPSPFSAPNLPSSLSNLTSSICTDSSDPATAFTSGITTQTSSTAATLTAA
eukprot:jgi/Hompol1/456/HPOL_000556-RA